MNRTDRLYGKREDVNLNKNKLTVIKNFKHHTWLKYQSNNNKIIINVFILFR